MNLCAKSLRTLINTAAALLPLPLYAAGLGQQGAIEEVVVTAEKLGSLSAVSSEQARQELQKVPGAIGFVLADDFLDNFTQSIGDTLVFTPGVFADTSAQRENRISIRGSGLNATFERRGITVLRDGVPISRASGITEFQEIDPLSIQHLEVFKGANGLRFGAASLGGAINIVTPTGATRQPGTNVRIEGGSFDTSRISVSTSGRQDGFDYYGAVTKLNSDGFRDHSEVDSIYSFGNVGFQLSENIETRFYITALQDDFELAGSVSEDQALRQPERAGTFNESHDQDRNLDVYRLSNRTVIAFDSATLELGGWLASRELDHAITPFVGIIDQDESEFGVSAQLNGDLDISDVPTAWSLGFSYAKSDNEAKVFENLLGSAGALTSEDGQDAENLVAYGQLDLSVTDKLHLILGLQYVDSKRSNKNILSLSRFGRPPEDDTGELNFDQFNGRVGLLWQASDNVQYYANISQGYEPPGISDITSGGAQPFTDLDAQESITYEIGSRGQYGRFAWDAAIYRSEIENEFIDVENDFVPGLTNTDNAEGDTIHQGVELGVDITLLDGDAMQLTMRNIFTYNDFKFDDEPTYGDNTLAGVPEFIYVTELRLDVAEQWYAGINLRHIANGAYVDFANTKQADGYELLGLTAGWQITESLRLFGSVENILDEEFVSNVSTVADFSVASSTDLFTPGEGRSAYLGLNWNF